MALSLRQGERVQLAAYRPPSLPDVMVSRFMIEGHLCRVVPHHFGTVLHIAGSSQWAMRGHRWSSSPGTIDLKMPGEVYAESARNGRAQFQVVLFDDALVEEARATFARPLAAPTVNAIDGGDPRVRPIAAFHRRLLDDGATALELEQDLSEALSAFVELTSAPEGTRFRPSAWSTAVTRARALLDARITETITLDELASHARLDKYRLCRAFRDEVGLPPHAYVTHRRVALAQDLLMRGLSQAEVAVSVGLYDQSQLHRHFKRIVGLTPGSYVRAVR